jgi:hypothetical protein
MPVKGSYTPIFDRIRGRWIANELTGCWLWQGSHSSQGLYPTVGGEGGSVVYLHRFMYEATYGPIPSELPADGSSRWEVHHACGERSCINPQHMALVSKRQHATIHASLRAEKRAARETRNTLPLKMPPTSLPAPAYSAVA